MGVKKPKSSSQLDHILYSTADFLWSGCLVAPLVVTYWRGTWDLLEDWVGLSSTERRSDCRQHWSNQAFLFGHQSIDWLTKMLLADQLSSSL